MDKIVYFLLENSENLSGGVDTAPPQNHSPSPHPTRYTKGVLDHLAVFGQLTFGSAAVLSVSGQVVNMIYNMQMIRLCKIVARKKTRSIPHFFIMQ